MTRKDYVLIAAALASAQPDPYADGARFLERQHKRDCEDIADALASDNPRFDRARFLRACGITTEG